MYKNESNYITLWSCRKNLLYIFNLIFEWFFFFLYIYSLLSLREILVCFKRIIIDLFYANFHYSGTSEFQDKCIRISGTSANQSTKWDNPVWIDDNSSSYCWIGIESVTVRHGRRIVLFVFIVRVFIHFPYVEGYKKKIQCSTNASTRRGTRPLCHWIESSLSVGRWHCFSIPGQRPGYWSIKTQIKRKKHFSDALLVVWMVNWIQIW